MLHSELKPRSRYDVIGFVLFAIIGVGAVTGIVGTAYHLWGDDHRVSRLNELEKQAAAYAATYTKESRTQGHAEVSGTTVSGTGIGIGSGSQLFTVANDILFDTTAKFSPMTSNLIVVDGPNAPDTVIVQRDYSHDIVTVHPRGQARTPKVRSNRDTGNPNVVMADKAKAVTAIDTEFKLQTGYDNPKGYCAKECKQVDECFAVVLVDEMNHVELDLPCVNGHVGTWQVTKLP